MSFKGDVVKIRSLNGRFYPGLRALRKNAEYIVLKDECSHRLMGSIDLDTAYEDSDPDGARWDYGVGIQSGTSDAIDWIEIHPASTSEIDKVLKKLAWLKNWFNEDGKSLKRYTRHYIWISSGKTRLLPTAQKKKSMAQQGLMHKGNRYLMEC